MVELGPTERRPANDIASIELESGFVGIDRDSQSIAVDSGFVRIGLEPGKTARIGKCDGVVEVYFYEPEPKGLWRRLRAAWRALTA